MIESSSYFKLARLSREVSKLKKLLKNNKCNIEKIVKFTEENKALKEQLNNAQEISKE